jgi:hypothetical protein
VIVFQQLECAERGTLGPFYYLQWHMRRCLAPMLFDEPDPAARDAQRASPVAKAEPSPAWLRSLSPAITMMLPLTEPAGGIWLDN